MDAAGVRRRRARRHRRRRRRRHHALLPRRRAAGGLFRGLSGGAAADPGAHARDRRARRSRFCRRRRRCGGAPARHAHLPRDDARIGIGTLVAHRCAGDAGPRLHPELVCALPRPRSWHADADTAVFGRRAAGADRGFVSVTMAHDRSVADAEALATFIRAAAARGIAVWAVEGDPYAVLPSEREKFRGRAAVLAAFNRSQLAGARLSGVQFDVEPYLVPGYALAPDRWIAVYLDTLAALGAAARMPVEAAIPFWFPLDRWGERLAGVVGSVALMDYRTRPDDIERYAAPVLAWGTVHHRSVHIGLEFGPLGAEERRLFRRAPQGQLWRVPLGGHEALVLLNAPAENPSGPTYALASHRDIAADSLSFHGREAALSELLPALGQAFAPWPSFAGIALHGLF